MMMESDYTPESIEVRKFPPFIRVAVERKARKHLFSKAMRRVSTIEREYIKDKDFIKNLYGEKKGIIVKTLFEGGQPARHLIEESGLSPSAVYHFLKKLREDSIVVKKGHNYYLQENCFDTLSLSDIVKLEEDPTMRRKYGISVKELELAYYLWGRYLKVTPEEGGYAQTYHSRYTLADAIHRWRTGRTDTPVWALDELIDLSEFTGCQKSIDRYHLPPGIPIIPYYNGEYRLPVVVSNDLDKVVIQLLQKMSKNHLYTFPKRDEWLFENLHKSFGEFDDSTSRIPSAIIEILKSYYQIDTMRRCKASIPSAMKNRWAHMDRLNQIKEESSLLLHIISLASRSNGGFEITSRSKSFLRDISHLSSDLNLGSLTVRKKHNRPHFRAYLSESKAEVLRRYAHLFQVYPDLKIWLRIPLNQIAEKIVATDGTFEAIEKVCYEELEKFAEAILKSLERKRRGRTYDYTTTDYTQHKEEITHHFWQQKMIPSPKKVEELMEVQLVEEETLVYA